MLDFDLIIKCQDHGEINGIAYDWGAKPDPSLPTNLIKESDCSGWTRYLFGRCGISIPEGSWDQHDWCEQQGWPKSTDYAAILDSDAAFICFAEPVPGEHPGHVWITYEPIPPERWTIECHGGGGVKSRIADAPVLERLFTVGYRLN